VILIGVLAQLERRVFNQNEQSERTVYENEHIIAVEERIVGGDLSRCCTELGRDTVTGIPLDRGVGGGATSSGSRPRPRRFRVHVNGPCSIASPGRVTFLRLTDKGIRLYIEALSRGDEVVTNVSQYFGNFEDTGTRLRKGETFHIRPVMKEG
jgi:hypothetical protein